MQRIINKVPKKNIQTDDIIHMYFEDGSECKWYHSQDCCETVEVEEVIGDFNDLIGHPLLVAEVRTDDNRPALSKWDESFTWTFYTFRNIGGSVDVRWYGSSNGYYSEGVYFAFRESAIDNWNYF